MPDVCEDLSPFPLDRQAVQCDIGPGQAVARADTIAECWVLTETDGSELCPVQSNCVECRPVMRGMVQERSYPLRNANTKAVGADFSGPKRVSLRGNLAQSRFWESVVAADTVTPLASLWDLSIDKPSKSVNKRSRVSTETTVAAAARRGP